LRPRSTATLRQGHTAAAGTPAEPRQHGCDQAVRPSPLPPPRRCQLPATPRAAKNAEATMTHDNTSVQSPTERRKQLRVAGFAPIPGEWQIPPIDKLANQTEPTTVN